jgi:hypothetical protein
MGSGIALVVPIVALVLFTSWTRPLVIHLLYCIVSFLLLLAAAVMALLCQDLSIPWAASQWFKGSVYALIYME